MIRLADMRSFQGSPAASRSYPEDCSVAYGGVHVATGVGSDEVVSRSWEQSRAEFLLGRMIPHQGTFHRRSLFERVGRFDESYRIRGDYELLLRELPAHPPLYMEGLVVAEIGAAGVSRRPETFTTVLKELHRARRQHGYARSPAILEFGLHPFAHARVPHGPGGTRLRGPGRFSLQTSPVAVGHRSWRIWQPA